MVGGLFCPPGTSAQAWLPDEVRLQKGEVLISYKEASGIGIHEVQGEILCEAPLEVVWSVLTDYANYAKFFPDLTTVQVAERTGDGARVKVKILNLWPYPTVNYIMQVKENKPAWTQTWKLEKGNVKTLYGTGVLQPFAKDPKKTKVTYVMAYDPGWLMVPNFNMDFANRSVVIDRLLGLRKEARKRKAALEGKPQDNVKPQWGKAPFWWEKDNQDNKDIKDRKPKAEKPKDKKLKNPPPPPKPAPATPPAKDAGDKPK